MIQKYGFEDKLRASEGDSVSSTIESILLNNIPGSLSVHKAHVANDRKGTDWWVECQGSKHLSVDAKVRDVDWKPKGEDDLALEIWSVVEKGVIGWTLDESKRSDFILWFWKDTKRFCLLSFPMLCRVFRDHKDEWVERYKDKVCRQFTPRENGGGYHSECIFVPYHEIWAKIFHASKGSVE